MTVAVILAAGKGTRMRTHGPKVGHPVGGRPMIAHVHAAVIALGDVEPLYVLGHLHEAVRALLPADALVVLQEEQRGTGHALQTAIAAVGPEHDQLLVLYGDMPLLTAGTLALLREDHRRRGATLTVLSAELQTPFGYGRIVRDDAGTPLAVVEEKELSPAQRSITEVNTGVYAVAVPWLRQALAALPEHPDGEYYLTDLVEMAAGSGALSVLAGGDPDELMGINDRRQLAQAERLMRARTNGALLDAGVTLVDPAHAYIAADATIGMDTVIEPDVIIGEGVTIGEGCHIGSGSRIVASALGDRCQVLASVIEYAQVDADVRIGPFSHLRPGAALAAGVRVGNFAEIKNSSLGPGTHMGHFGYVGDADVGADVNVGAGTVVANYDGVRKHHSTIGDRVFLGSGTILCAPVTLGEDSATGAGAVVTRDVPPGVTVVGIPARPFRRGEAAADSLKRPE